MPRWLVLVAGPNGAGKSTLVGSGIFRSLFTTPEDAQPFEILNPDRLAAQLRAGGAAVGGGGASPGDARANPDLDAVVQIEAMVEAAIDGGRSIGVETVLSSPKYQRLVERALAADFRFAFFYIYLQTADLHAQRVAQRLAMGGHDVPLDKIVARYERSLALAPWFAARCHVGAIWDNSYDRSRGAGPRLAAEKNAKGRWVPFAPFANAPAILAEGMKVLT